MALITEKIHNSKEGKDIAVFIYFSDTYTNDQIMQLWLKRGETQHNTKTSTVLVLLGARRRVSQLN